VTFDTYANAIGILDFLLDLRRVAQEDASGAREGQNIANQPEIKACRRPDPIEQQSSAGCRNRIQMEDCWQPVMREQLWISAEALGRGLGRAISTSHWTHRTLEDDEQDGLR